MKRMLLPRRPCKICGEMFQPGSNAGALCSDPCRAVSKRQCYETRCKVCGYVAQKCDPRERKNPDYVCRWCKTEERRSARQLPCQWCGELAGWSEQGKPRRRCERCYGLSYTLSLRYGVSRQYVQQLFDRSCAEHGFQWRRQALPYVDSKLKQRGRTVRNG